MVKPMDEKAVRRKHLKHWVRIVSLLGLIYLFSVSLSPAKIAFNISESVHGKIFFIVLKRLPKKGELAAFWPPETCFFKKVLFVKYVKGVAGDMVTRSGEREEKFYINGEYVGTAKRFSRGGLPLVASTSGVIPVNAFFMWSPHEDSYDSRYKEIGWIGHDRIIGTAYRLL